MEKYATNAAVPAYALNSQLGDEARRLEIHVGFGGASDISI
jgi:hypothetical protein